MMKNTRNTYGQIAKCFHWLMAFLIIGMYLVAYMMINISPSHFRDSLYNLHKATGLLLLGLVALRLWWRVFYVQPTLPASISICISCKQTLAIAPNLRRVNDSPKRSLNRASSYISPAVRIA